MIGGNDRFATELEQFRDDAPATFVHRLHRFDPGFDHAGMTDHVGIGEIQNNQIVVRHPGKHFVGHFERAHFGFQIVSSNLG